PLTTAAFPKPTVIVSEFEVSNSALSWSPPATVDSTHVSSTEIVCVGEHVVCGSPRVAKSLAHTCTKFDPVLNGKVAVSSVQSTPPPGGHGEFCAATVPSTL